MAKQLEDYVEVSERIEKFYAKYPEGSLRCKEIRSVDIGGDHFLVYIAQAFRSPTDEAPAEGAAWEPVPGKTNFTRDSELMNAETSAWGRAIAALGFEVKRGIASRQEVMNRRGDGPAPKGTKAPSGDAASPAQKRAITNVLNRLQFLPEHATQIKANLKGDTKSGASQILDVAFNKETDDETKRDTLISLAGISVGSDIPADDTDLPTVDDFLADPEAVL